MSHELYMILDFVFFALSVMGNVGTIVLAGVAVLFAFKGIKATKALSAKVLNKQVTVTWTKLDQYQRLLANITVGSQWVNQAMVAEGWAWHYV